MSAKERIVRFLREHVGETVTGEQVGEVAEIASYARRIRELRADGWQIASHHDDESLRPGEYKLLSDEKQPGHYEFSQGLSGRLRAEVLERNGYTCQMCGAGAGDLDDLNPGRTVRLHVGHIVDRSHGGEDVPTNLRALCATCNQGAKNIVQEPPSQIWLLGQIRRANKEDQRAVLKWLKRKFGD